ncbi:MAG: DMT family transporter [Clostridia bacterium]|nr:DMT family transporter [Clostridia bacterium]
MNYLERHPSIMLVVGIMGISLSAIFVRFSDASAAVTAAYRLLWTVLLMSPMVWAKKATRTELLSVSARTVLLCAFSGIALAFHFYWWFDSLKHTTVASSTVIVCTEVIWVAIGNRLFFSGRLKGKQLLAIAITLLGSVLVALSDSASAGTNQIYGDFLSLIAAVAVAVYTLLGKEARRTVSTTVYTYIVYGCCAAVLCLLCLIRGEALMAFPAGAVVSGLLLSVCSTLCGHSIFSWCLKYFSPTFVSASKLCEPVVAAAFALVLFGEVPVMLQIIGAVFIIGGVLFYSRNNEDDCAK